MVVTAALCFFPANCRDYQGHRACVDCLQQSVSRGRDRGASIMPLSPFNRSADSEDAPTVSAAGPTTPSSELEEALEAMTARVEEMRDVIEKLQSEVGAPCPSLLPTVQWVEVVLTCVTRAH